MVLVETSRDNRRDEPYSSSMARVLFLIVGLTLAVCAVRADWAGLRLGGDEAEVLAQVGDPLMSNVSRGWATWIYDDGGYIAFEAGRAVYWQVPRSVAALSLEKSPLSGAGPLPTTALAPVRRAGLGGTVPSEGPLGVLGRPWTAQTGPAPSVSPSKGQRPPQELGTPPTVPLVRRRRIPVPAPPALPGGRGNTRTWREDEFVFWR